MHEITNNLTNLIQNFILTLYLSVSCSQGEDCTPKVDNSTSFSVYTGILLGNTWFFLQNWLTLQCNQEAICILT